MYRRLEFWELRGRQRIAFLAIVIPAGIYAIWIGAFSDGAGIGCRILRQHWRDYGNVPTEVRTDAENPQYIRTFGVHCRPADAHVAPDCAVTWSEAGRVHQRRCGPIDQGSIEDWL